MWGIFSYLISIFIFAGSAVLLEFILGYHFLKRYFKHIKKVVLAGIVITPFVEWVAIRFSAWGYNSENNLGLIILSSPIETLVFAIFVSLAISFAVTAWTFYEDIGKPILRTSLYDVFHGTYAIWRKKPPKFEATPRGCEL